MKSSKFYYNVEICVHYTTFYVIAVTTEGGTLKFMLKYKTHYMPNIVPNSLQVRAKFIKLQAIFYSGKE